MSHAVINLPMTAINSVANPNLTSCTVPSNDQLALDLDSLDSEALFKGKRLIQINHGGSVYLLRITRAGKLILTK